MLLYLQRNAGLTGLTSAYMEGDTYTGYSIENLACQLTDACPSGEELQYSDSFGKAKDLRKLYEKILKKRKNTEDSYVLSASMCRMIMNYLEDAGNYVCYYMPLEMFDKAELSERICLSMEEKYPVLLQTGATGKLALYEDQKLGKKAGQMNAGEWAWLS